MIDPLSPELVPVSEIAATLPHRPSPTVICRWVLKGLNGTKLETLMICGRRYTTRGEWCRFIQDSQPRQAPTLSENDTDQKLREKGLLGVAPSRGRRRKVDQSPAQLN